MQTYSDPPGMECVIYAPDPDDFVPAAFHADFPAGGLYGLDVEGTYMEDLKQWDPDFRVRTCQFATEGYAWVLDLEDPAQYAAAAELLADETTRFASHSAMDVLSCWVTFGIDISRRNVDTLILGKMAAPEIKLGGADLKSLAVRYGMKTLHALDKALEEHMKDLWKAHTQRLRAEAKAAGKPTKGLPTAAWGTAGKRWAWANIPTRDPMYTTYAGLDAIVARRLVDQLIPDTGAPADLIKVELWLAGAANRLQMRGMKVDRQRVEEWHAAAAEATQQADAAVRDVCGLGSGQNVAMVAWITDRMPWGDLPVTDKGSPSLAGDAWDLIAARPDCPADVSALCVAMKVVQEHANMLKKMEGVLAGLDADDVIRPALNTLEAVTARMSSSGPNMQNFSGDTRGVFVAREGYALISCDFDQVELRVVAGLAEEPVMIQAILDGADLHQITADLIGQPRKVGKMTNFLVVYGGGAGKLAKSAGIAFELAQSVLTRFWESYRRIWGYNQALKELRHELRTFSWRRIPVPRDDRTGEPKSYANLNYMIQSSARDLLVRAWWRLDQEYGMGDWVWMAIHDEMVLEVPLDQVPRALAAIQDCMTMDFFGVPITATAEVLMDADGVSRWRKG